MKKLFTSLKSLLIIVAIALSGFNIINAQERELVIDPGTDIFTFINALKDDDGMLSTNVFILKRDAVYFMSETLYTNDDITLKGEEDKTEVTKPAMIIPRAAPDGNYVGTWFSMEGLEKTFSAADIIFQMLSISAMETGVNVDVLVEALASSQRIILNRCIINGNGNNVIGSKANGQYIKITNCRLRNNRNLSDDWSGGWIYGNWTTGGWRDSLIFKNNTSINIGNTALRCFTGETSKAVIIDHNTFFGSARPAVYTHEQSNVQITNNLYVASHASGLPKNDGSKSDIEIWGEVVAEGYFHKGAMFSVGLLDAAAYPIVDSLFGFDVSGTQESIEEQRTFIIKNNCTYWPPELVTAWDTIDYYPEDPLYGFGDTVAISEWPIERHVDDYTFTLDKLTLLPAFRMDYQEEWIFAHQPNTVIENNYGHVTSLDALTSDFDPGFDPATVKRILDPMNTWIDGFRNEEDWTPFMCNIDDPGKEVDLAWPLPENLTYTNETLKRGGTDGLPVGDLNWFKDLSSISNNKANIMLEVSNYPNPFSSTTTIKYTLKVASDITLTVFDAFGKQIELLVNEKQQSGTYKINWDGSKMADGIYLYKLDNGFSTITKKMLLTK